MNSMNREQVTWVGVFLLGVIGLILFNTLKADTNLQPIVAVTALAILFSLPEAGAKTHRLAVCAVGALYVAYGAFPSIMEKNFSESFLGMSLPDTAGVRNGMFWTYVIAALIIWLALWLRPRISLAQFKEKTHSEAEALKRSWD